MSQATEHQHDAALRSQPPAGMSLRVVTIPEWDVNNRETRDPSAVTLAPATTSEPSGQMLEQWARESAQLETATPQEILQWAVERFAPRFTMATAFGPEGMTLIHMLAEIAPDTPIFNLDTGYQFPETLELARAGQAAIRDRGGAEAAGVDGGAIRGSKRRSGLQDAIPIVLPWIARSGSCTNGDRRHACLGQRHSSRSEPGPSTGADRRLGQQVPIGQSQPAGQLDEEGRVGPDSQTRYSLQPACTTRAIRVSAAGPARGACAGRGRTGGALEWFCRRPSVACTHSAMIQTIR